MDQITKSLLDTFTCQNDLGGLNESAQFEYFANYCITSKLNRTSFELEDVHTGSGGDCAIDGLFLNVNGKIITDGDELRKVCRTPAAAGVEIGKFIL